MRWVLIPALPQTSDMMLASLEQKTQGEIATAERIRRDAEKAQRAELAALAAQCMPFEEVAAGASSIPEAHRHQHAVLHVSGSCTERSDLHERLNGYCARVKYLLSLAGFKNIFKARCFGRSV